MAVLTDNSTIPDSLITFDASTYHFYRGMTDITDDLSRAEKERLVPDFDAQIDNDRLSAEKGSGAKYGLQPLSESTLGPFVDNIVTDPLGAPIDALSNKANQFFGASGIQKLLVTGFLIFAAYVFIAGGWFRRR